MEPQFAHQHVNINHKAGIPPLVGNHCQSDIDELLTLAKDSSASSFQKNPKSRSSYPVHTSPLVKLKNRLRSRSVGNKVCNTSPSFVSGLKPKKMQDIDNILAVADARERVSGFRDDASVIKGSCEGLRLKNKKSRSKTFTALHPPDIDGLVEVGNLGMQKYKSMTGLHQSMNEFPSPNGSPMTSVTDAENLSLPRVSHDQASTLDRQRRKRGFNMFNKKGSMPSLDGGSGCRNESVMTKMWSSAPRVDFILRHNDGKNIAVCPFNNFALLPASSLVAKHQQIDIDCVISIGSLYDGSQKHFKSNAATIDEKPAKRRRWSLPARISPSKRLKEERALKPPIWKTHSLELVQDADQNPSHIRRYRSTPIPQPPYIRPVNSHEIDIDNVLDIGTHCAFVEAFNPTAQTDITVDLPDADEVFALTQDSEATDINAKPILQPRQISEKTVKRSLLDDNHGCGSPEMRRVPYVYVGRNQDVSELMASTEAIYQQKEKEIRKAVTRKKLAEVIHMPVDDIALQKSHTDIDKLLSVGQERENLPSLHATASPMSRPMLRTPVSRSHNNLNTSSIPRKPALLPVPLINNICASTALLLSHSPAISSSVIDSFNPTENRDMETNSCYFEGTNPTSSDKQGLIGNRRTSTETESIVEGSQATILQTPLNSNRSSIADPTLSINSNTELLRQHT